MGGGRGGGGQQWCVATSLSLSTVTYILTKSFWSGGGLGLQGSVKGHCSFVRWPSSAPPFPPPLSPERFTPPDELLGPPPTPKKWDVKMGWEGKQERSKNDKNEGRIIYFGPNISVFSIERWGGGEKMHDNKWRWRQQHQHTHTPFLRFSVNSNRKKNVRSSFRRTINVWRRMFWRGWTNVSWRRRTIDDWFCPPPFPWAF